MALKLELLERIDPEALVEKIRADRWREIDPADLYRKLEALSFFARMNLERGHIPEDPTRNFMYGSEATKALDQVFAALKRRVGRPRLLSSEAGLEIDGSNSGIPRRVTALEVIRRERLREATSVRNAKKKAGNPVTNLVRELYGESRVKDPGSREMALSLLDRYRVVTAKTTDRELRIQFKMTSRDLPKPRKPATK